MDKNAFEKGRGWTPALFLFASGIDSPGMGGRETGDCAPP
jgi:hypothetical protein